MPEAARVRYDRRRSTPGRGSMRRLSRRYRRFAESWGKPTMEEVDLWRGTPDQRALRSVCRKLGQFTYFDRQLGHPDWAGKTVLDFGGNQGNLLLDSNGRIRPQEYYGVDVIEDAIEEG